MRSVWPPIALMLALLAAFTLPACGTVMPKTSTPASQEDAQAGFTRAEVHSFSAFALYWLGSSFHRRRLTAITRRHDAAVAAQKVRVNYVDFVYGDCAATDETGCPPPLEIQVWPACERSLSDYTLTPAGDPVPRRMTSVRGVPAAFFERGLRLELYTGDVTVVIFGLKKQSVLRAAAGLSAANALASGRTTLPQPVGGAMEGRLTCKT
jgi:hypothetical protein